MEIAVITLPDFFEGETGLVNELFSLGLGRLHLRKPGAGKEETAEWLGRIRPEYLPRIVLHDHHELAVEFNLGGIHLNGRNPEAPSGMDRNRFSVSKSCHSLQEVRENLGCCDYLFLSPVFDSISKEGYGAAFSPAELERAAQENLLQEKVYALGGICAEKLPEVRQMGFHGAAVLGWLWQSCASGGQGLAERLGVLLDLAGRDARKESNQ
ncbi:MAG: thiamine phosphate synthase [Candidatus Cryptobacteroides sp.]